MMMGVVFIFLEVMQGGRMESFLSRSCSIDLLPLPAAPIQFAFREERKISVHKDLDGFVYL